MEAKPLCEVCGKYPSFVVVCSTFVPQSFAYCQTCFSSGVEPWSACCYVTWNAGGLDNLVDYAKDVVLASMTFLGKTQEDLAAEVARIDEDMNRMAADQEM